jgi:ribosomal protein L37AE/L43A
MSTSTRNFRRQLCFGLLRRLLPVFLLISFSCNPVIMAPGYRRRSVIVPRRERSTAPPRTKTGGTAGPFGPTRGGTRRNTSTSDMGLRRGSKSPARKKLHVKNASHKILSQEYCSTCFLQYDSGSDMPCTDARSKNAFSPPFFPTHAKDYFRFLSSL